MDLNNFIQDKFKISDELLELEYDNNNNINYIYYNEIENKKGSRYDMIIQNKLDINHFSTHSPSCLKVFDLFTQLKITKKDSILDIGSGKGFALIIASLFDFNNIKGIEISTKDYNICKKNLEILRILIVPKVFTS